MEAEDLNLRNRSVLSSIYDELEKFNEGEFKVEIRPSARTKESYSLDDKMRHVREATSLLNFEGFAKNFLHWNKRKCAEVVRRYCDENRILNNEMRWFILEESYKHHALSRSKNGTLVISNFFKRTKKFMCTRKFGTCASVAALFIILFVFIFASTSGTRYSAGEKVEKDRCPFTTETEKDSSQFAKDKQIRNIPGFVLLLGVCLVISAVVFILFVCILIFKDLTRRSLKYY